MIDIFVYIVFGILIVAAIDFFITLFKDMLKIEDVVARKFFIFLGAVVCVMTITVLFGLARITPDMIRF